MKNNDYTDIRIVDDTIYVRIYGIDSIFMANIDYYKNQLIIYRSKYTDIIFCDINDIDNRYIFIEYFDQLKSLSIDINDIKTDEKLKPEQVQVVGRYKMINKINEKIKLKPEVGYEIINKLNELLKIDLEMS